MGNLHYVERFLNNVKQKYEKWYQLSHQNDSNKSLCADPSSTTTNESDVLLLSPHMSTLSDLLTRTQVSLLKNWVQPTKNDTVRGFGNFIGKFMDAVMDDDIGNSFSKIKMRGLIDLIEQLHLFMSILLLIAATCKSSTLVVCEVKQLDQNSISILKKWCKINKISFGFVFDDSIVINENQNDNDSVSDIVYNNEIKKLKLEILKLKNNNEEVNIKNEMLNDQVNKMCVETKVETSRLGSDIEDGLRAEFENKLKAEYNDKRKAEFEDKIKAQFNEKLKTDFGKKLRANITDKLKVEFENKIKPEIEKKLKTKFETEFKAKIENDSKTKTETETETENDTNTEIDDNLKTKIENQVKADLIKEYDNRFKIYSNKLDSDKLKLQNENATLKTTIEGKDNEKKLLQEQIGKLIEEKTEITKRESELILQHETEMKQLKDDNKEKIKEAKKTEKNDTDLIAQYEKQIKDMDMKINELKSSKDRYQGKVDELNVDKIIETIKKEKECLYIDIEFRIFKDGKILCLYDGKSGKDESIEDKEILIKCKTFQELIVNQSKAEQIIIQHGELIKEILSRYEILKRYCNKLRGKNLEYLEIIKKLSKYDKEEFSELSRILFNNNIFLQQIKEIVHDISDDEETLMMIDPKILQKLNILKCEVETVRKGIEEIIGVDREE